MFRRYRFRNTWSLAAPAREVFGALADLASYPRWWRDVRTVRQLDEDTAQVTCRSVLPYSLDLWLRRAEEDNRAGRLRVDLTGDLEGYCGCLVTGNGHRSQVVVYQEVELRKPQLRRVEPWLGPLYRANHAAMMWRGRRGLLHYLTAPRKPGA
ncbi:SRPBCC family protein [Haloechinothrix sp. LS1_15]|uniref:SRPBCC family protein n=1 Tax=Haloechinothrix sp. LS1_15 TaxID=2652248 RepID=UPI002944D402|nr:SRPBCC family protein [Haloechinothrix sp. LS1_15]MDV6012255.1 polyketide cyclase [Haloechinothrix sp. LS1_15]